MGMPALHEISVRDTVNALRGGWDPFGFASGQAPPVNDLGSGTQVPERQYSILPPPQRPRRRGSVRGGDDRPGLCATSNGRQAGRLSHRERPAGMGMPALHEISVRDTVNAFRGGRRLRRLHRLRTCATRTAGGDGSAAMPRSFATLRMTGTARRARSP